MARQKASYIYALLINRSDIDKEVFNECFIKDFKREFKSYDYFKGYIDGIGFGKIQIKLAMI